MTKQLLIHRPDSPLDFLIERIGKQEPIRVFITGPPGSIAKNLSRRISKDLGFTTISTEEILKKESKKDTAKNIADCLKNYRYAPDDITARLVKNHILKCENEYKNWVLEGFPKTKAQALAIQKIGIIPDKFILLNVDRDESIEKIKKAMIDDGTSLVGDGLERAAETTLSEYNLHIKGVKECYSKFLYEAEADKPLDQMEQDLMHMLKLKLKDPMRPPRIIILGPPGSGRATQAKNIARRYGIAHVSVMELFKTEMAKNTPRGKQIAECVSKGEPVPNSIVISLVEHRLKESDCIVNGWVMDGFPKTKEQVTLLTQMKINPTKVVILECKQEVCIERLGMKRIDPITGFYYNLADQAPEDKEVHDRLVGIEGNDEATVIKRWNQWDEFVGKIEEIFNNQLLLIKTGSKSTAEISHIICESI